MDLEPPQLTLKMTLVFQTRLNWGFNKEVSKASQDIPISVQLRDESRSNLTCWTAPVLTHSQVHSLPLKVPNSKAPPRLDGGDINVALLFFRLFEDKDERFLAQSWLLPGQGANTKSKACTHKLHSCLCAFAQPTREHPASHFFVLGWPAEVQVKSENV